MIGLVLGCLDWKMWKIQIPPSEKFWKFRNIPPFWIAYLMIISCCLPHFPDPLNQPDTVDLVFF